MTHLRGTGFTLIELVVVVLIVALLLVLTLPSYQRHLSDTRRSLANAALLEAMIRQEQFFLEYKRYAERLTDLEFPTHPYALDAEGNAVSSLADDRIYLIELTTYNNAYTLFAVPQLVQAPDQRCGTLSLDSAGIKRASGNSATRECW